MFSKLQVYFDGTKKEITLLIISAFSLILSFINVKVFSLDLAWVAVILCGIPIIKEAIEGLFLRFDIKADVLVSIALVASIIIGEIFAAGEVAFIMQIGALLEDMTVIKAREGIEKLVKLTPSKARLVAKEKEKIISAKDVCKNDIIRVIPGETIPVDGIIIKGQTSIDQSIMTGESMPVDKNIGDEVFSGTVNQFGTFDMKATKVGEDSSIQRMIKLVKSADADKAKIVSIADKWATWIVIIALLSSVLTWIVTGEIIRAVTILVVFCPCALVLATPTAIMAAIGNVTKYGFLVKEGDALERLSMVSKITFDKTGTLTFGKPKVNYIKSINNDYSTNEIFELLASLEQHSEHPLGKAIVEAYKKEHSLLNVESFEVIPGRGLKGVINEKVIIAGNKKLMLDNQVIINKEYKEEIEIFEMQGNTITYIAVNNIFSGFVCLSDTLRDEATNVVNQIKKMNITPVLLTGDNKNSALHIAKKLGIRDVLPNCLPEDKLKFIEEEQKTNNVCMIGDGINDAPALKKSYVGIAMGGVGSDIAVDAADIVLVNDDISQITHLMCLAKKMMITIKFNLSFSMILNFVSIILAMSGILHPVLGALVHNAGSVFVIINSSFLLKWEKNK